MNTRPGLIGRKIGMTQLFTENGDMVGVTVVEVTPNAVVQVKTAEGADGYSAVQLGFGEQKPRRLTKPERGHMEKAAVPTCEVLKEIRVDVENLARYPQGQVVHAEDFFAVGERIDVTGVSKGCGFAGVMKRYHFAGFEATHGTHEFFRHGGSIGTRLTPGMTFKGTKMGGHMGDERVTVQNIPVVRMDADRHLLFLHGAVPGATGGIVVLRKAVRAPRTKVAK